MKEKIVKLPVWIEDFHSDNIIKIGDVVERVDASTVEFRGIQYRLGKSYSKPVNYTDKQVFEWVKTGHWNLKQFQEWVATV